MKPWLLVIDGVRSHNALAAAAATHFRVAHVWSSYAVFSKQAALVNSGFYQRAFIYSNPEQIAVELEGLAVAAVFPAQDSGHELANILRSAVSLPTVPQSLLKIYTDKYELYRALGQPAQTHNFTGFNNKRPRSVVKPRYSRDSGGCLDVQTFQVGQAVPDSSDRFICEYYQGTEYAVDAVSLNGVHKLAAVWRYRRSDSQLIWKDTVELVRGEQEVALCNRLWSQVRQWLDSIGHQTGPTHTELRQDQDTVRCIEINFRLNGHMSVGTLRAALQYNQVDLTAQALAGVALPGPLDSYTSTAYVNRVYFENTSERNHDDVAWRQIAQMQSVDWIFHHASPGEPLPISVQTYQSCAAIVIMRNTDPSLLEQHRQAVLAALQRSKDLWPL